MAYDLEYAKYSANQDIMSSDILEMFKNIEFVIPENIFNRIDNFIYPEVTKLNISNLKDNKLKYLFVIDGSKFENDFENNPVKLGLFNINQCVVNVDKVVSYVGEKSPHPQLYQDIKEHINVRLLLPLSGLKNSKHDNERDFFRYVLFELFKKINNPIVQWLNKNNYTITKTESLFETYKVLLSNINKIDNVPHSCLECRRAGRFLSLKAFKDNEQDTIKCKCDNDSKDIYITDLLGFHEQLNSDISNESLTTQIMLVLEKIISLNLIRLIVNNNHVELIEQSAFILDGTLAIYSYSSWLSEAINNEIFELKSKYPLLLMSVEKTGNFVEHFKKIDKYYSIEPLKNNMLLFLDDDYIKKHIHVYDNDNFYGQKTYFGKKIFYKNSLGNLFVINISFEDEHDKYTNYNNRNKKEYIEKVKRLSDIILILENFSSQSHDNALSVISMANEGAALSSGSIGRKSLNDFLKKIIT